MIAKRRELSSEMKKRVEKTWRFLLVFCLGFLFAAVSPDGFFAPFGVAFCAVCPFGGFLGVLTGIMITSGDTFRYLIAASVTYFSSQIFVKSDSSGKEAKCFLLTAWSFLAASCAGFFFGNYTFKENALFALSGAVGGLFAWMLCLCKENGKKGRLPPSRLCFAAFAVCGTVGLVGLVGVGDAWTSVGVTLTVFFLCGLIRRCSMFYACTLSMIVAFGLCLFKGNMTYIAGFLVFGTLLGSLIEQLGRFAPPLSFIASAVLAALYAGDLFPAWQTVGAAALGGLIYVLLPSTAADKLFAWIVPSQKGRLLLNRKMNIDGKSKKKLEVCEQYAAGRTVCAQCEKRLVCWVHKYERTKIAFDRVKQDADEKHLCPFCPKTDDVLKAFRDEKVQKDGCAYALDFVKVSLSKEGETSCGDTSGTFAAKNGKYVLCIADGMGTGRAAAAQSERAERLIETLLKSGVEKRDVLAFVDRSVSEDGQEKTLGLDLSVIDLADGSCEMYKADAAPTFVVRHGTVFGVGSASLPLGLNGDKTPRRHLCRLEDGDILVMVSDGLCFDGPKILAQTVGQACREGETSCVALCERILTKLADKPSFREDDRTMILAKISAAPPS